MGLFSVLNRPQSFHLEQDTDLPVNREETGKVCFHFRGIKAEHLLFSQYNMKDLHCKNSNNDKTVCWFYMFDLPDVAI